MDDYYRLLAYPEDVPARRQRAAARWSAAVAASCPPVGHISCAPETFAPVVDDNGLIQVLDMSVAVTAPDQAALRTALARAAERFYGIDTEGREWAFADLENALDRGDEVFTPSFVSNIVEDEGALGVWIDTEGNPYPAMARAMLEVLLEELSLAGVVEAQIRPLHSIGGG